MNDRLADHLGWLGVSAILFVLVLVIVARGVRRHDHKADIHWRVRYPLIWAFVALSFTTPRMWAVARVGIALVLLTYAWMGVRQWRIERGQRAPASPHA